MEPKQPSDTERPNTKPDLRRRIQMAGKGNGGSYRSAISGRYVTAKHGKANPGTTVREM